MKQAIHVAFLVLSKPDGMWDLMQVSHLMNLTMTGYGPNTSETSLGAPFQISELLQIRIRESRAEYVHRPAKETLFITSIHHHHHHDYLINNYLSTPVLNVPRDTQAKYLLYLNSKAGQKLLNTIVFYCMSYSGMCNWETL